MENGHYLTMYKRFFMMCEGGKIDWACHANDAGAKDKTEDLHKMIKEYKFDEQE